MSNDYIKHPDVLVESLKNGWWSVRLNRPKSLHALDEQIVTALYSTFEYLHQNDLVKAIWFDSTTPKAFCAGGDVRKLRQLVLEDQLEQAKQFFKQEYALDRLLHHYAKPLVVWGEGYVMGGGLGLFMAAPFRLVTPHSRLAMPEINIGLYPDVGATRFLADRGTIGLFIGLTGSIMTAAGAYSIGWATHVCEQGRDIVLNHLTSIRWKDYSAGDFRAIDDTLNSLHRPLAAGPLQNSLDVIHSVCRGQDFIQDYQSICGLGNARSDWLRQASENLSNGSPTTAALTWLLWQWAKQNRSWNEVFSLEEEISGWKIQHADFIEGVRARLVDKDLQPDWQKKSFQNLADLFKDNPPFSESVDSWNALLRQYGILK
ncbi:enoyl-CoA hydratase/isomerase family protein [Acinetobacter qingfengensis]|uniref:3-hydroxyisobutyryl-CoA hydrolase n=1 Tax=Acinetobacter qingfengensis TaxID=1262585 RepID=A0A1E7R5U9_9GAMM|nr:enoyl-CoA hydratase/isomerase family protein [Acinetobacter qingfengensis]KAA8735600.1 enoyl-CoA hydratase/isomerase family protein [Acinetobacter qingfengensis]OEY94633.1 enoyl-CoA hydratase [Acinetobacter qingfengensis]